MTSQPQAEADTDQKVRAAWNDFATACTGVVAPEATFQAWLAYFMIGEFGLDRVAREPDFGTSTLTSPWRNHFKGHSVNVDLVVTRTPGIYLPRRAQLTDRSGVSRLGDLAVISELKVASTTMRGLTHTEVARDFWKLSMLLEAAEDRGLEVPLAYVCVLNNHAQHPYDLKHLNEIVLAAEEAHPRVIPLVHTAVAPT